jgi:hypothetical protein
MLYLLVGDVLTIPSPISLDIFERAIQVDREVLGMFYFGALGRRAARATPTSTSL